MDNHVHLLMKEAEALGESIKRITVGYVQLHNNKYGRSGYLFQNRFNSEVVENDQYFLTAVRYIHHNPLKAGMVSRLNKYPWSSYPGILQSYQKNQELLDTQVLEHITPKSQILSISQRKRIRMNVWK